MPLVLQAFGHKPNYWTHLNLDYIVALDEKLGVQSCYKSTKCTVSHCYILHKTESVLSQFVWSNQFGQNFGRVLY